MSMRQQFFRDMYTLTYSVAENTALSEQWEEQKVWECLEKAGLAEKLKALPQELSTNLGKKLSQDGVKLFGGETQKLGEGIVPGFVHHFLFPEDGLNV